MSAPTSEQMDVLLNFLEEHRDLARGHLRNVEGRLQSQRLWGEICITLNSMGGCTKTVQQWQRVWTDKKYLAKKNVAAARRSANATGGGPSTAPQLSQLDLRVVSIMGDGFGEPQTTARVPAFVEVNLPLGNATESQPQVIEEHFVINEPLPSGSGSLPFLQAPPNNNPNNEQQQQRPSTTRRARRQRASTDGSVTNRFFALEEQRVAQQAGWATEFAGIRAALTQHNNIMQAVLTQLCEISSELIQQRR